MLDETMKSFSEAFETVPERRFLEYKVNTLKYVFYNLLEIDIEFRIRRGIFAMALDYLKDVPSNKLMKDIWIHRFSLGESPEKIIIYFLGGIYGLEEDVFSLKDFMKNERYLKTFSEIIQSLKEEKITQELEKLISETEENITAWNLLLLCLKNSSKECNSLYFYHKGGHSLVE